MLLTGKSRGRFLPFFWAKRLIVLDVVVTGSGTLSEETTRVRRRGNKRKRPPRMLWRLSKSICKFQHTVSNDKFRNDRSWSEPCFLMSEITLCFDTAERSCSAADIRIACRRFIRDETIKGWSADVGRESGSVPSIIICWVPSQMGRPQHSV